MAYSSYPLKERLKEIFCKKSVLLEDNGWYKTMSGKWHNGHGLVLMKREALKTVRDKNG